MRHSRLRLALAALAAAGCGGGDSVSTGGNNNNPSCVVHFTGGPVADPAATCAPIVTYNAGTNVSGVGISAGAYNFAFTMEDVGAKITGGDFNNLQPGVSASLFIVNGTDNYTLNTGNGSQIGSFTLHITSLTPTSEGSTTSWYPNGTLDATVPADTGSGAHGTITAHATFSGY